jgi:putative transposase
MQKDGFAAEQVDGQLDGTPQRRLDAAATAGSSWMRRLRYLIHYRDSIFARGLDESIRNLGLTVLKSPPHSPKANAICERVIGTIRRECLDWLIPLSESHLRSIFKSWVSHYNHGRPHMALDPGVPDPPSEVVPSGTQLSRHRIGERFVVHVRSLLGGLHHEYLLAPSDGLTEYLRSTGAI